MQGQDRGPLGSLLYWAALAVFPVIIGWVTEAVHPHVGLEGYHESCRVGIVRRAVGKEDMLKGAETLCFC